MQHSLHSMPNMSIRTVRRILSISGLHGRVAAKKPPYLQMDAKLLKNFVFYDEARIELYSSRRQYVRRLVGQRFYCKHTTKTVEYGGPSIMIWGAIKGGGNLWTVLKSRVQKRLPKTAKELWVIIKEEWGALTKDKVIRLFNSIQHRLTNKKSF